MHILLIYSVLTTHFTLFPLADTLVALISLNVRMFGTEKLSKIRLAKKVPPPSRQPVQQRKCTLKDATTSKNNYMHISVGSAPF